ncbi:MAG: type II toxin-antitoxin system VapC family toxin [Candidatus Omnitrophica bacterium]|nr:type II toxin-antitoxin system VapC family toxin [Candidatus Omnitrophota bacterium]
MLFDTDVLIWIQRGNLKASHAVEQADERVISAQTYMELLQGASNKQQQHYIKSFLTDYSFSIMAFTENIGHRAMIYIEQFSLSHGMTSGDAIIAATAAENDLVLLSGNSKHFNQLSDIKFKVFRPSYRRWRVRRNANTIQND